jgi:DedD protein
VEPQPASASTTGMWAVQLGSFSNKENAEKLAADLRKQGYAAFLSQLDTPSGELHRVRIGPQKDRAAAETMAARLAKAGHPGQVVPHP